MISKNPCLSLKSIWMSLPTTFAFSVFRKSVA